MKLDRRTFILLGATGTVGACAGVAILGPKRVFGKIRYTYRKISYAFAGLTAPTKEEKAKLLAAEFPHLKFADGVCEAFITDLVKKDKINMSFTFEPEILKRFLLSTDYVQNGGKSDRVINYTVFYWPWSAPCFNPYLMMTS